MIYSDNPLIISMYLMYDNIDYVSYWEYSVSPRF